MQSVSRLSRWLLFALGLMASLMADVRAAELKLKAELVWGTDDASPPNKNYQPLAPALREKVRQLRWKNYFVVNAATSSPAKDSKKVDLSDRCSLTLKDIGNGQVQVSIFNPKAEKPAEPVATKILAVDKLKQGHAYVIGGDSKDRWDDAWLVFITIGE